MTIDPEKRLTKPTAPDTNNPIPAVDPAPTSSETDAIGDDGGFTLIRRGALQQRLGLWLFGLMLIAVLAGRYILRDPSAIDGTAAFADPTWSEPGGTDALGRSVLSRTTSALWMSMLLCSAATALGALVGVVTGLVSGYFGKITDRAVTLLVEIQMVVPQLLLVLVVVSVLGANPTTIAIGLAMSQWYVFSRVTRAEVVVLRQQQFVTSMLSLGMTNRRLLWRHILPNVSGAIIALVPLELAQSVLAEAGLGFLGLGIPPPHPSLGGLIADGVIDLSSGIWWTSLVPGAAVSLFILAANLLGDSVQSRFNAKVSSSSVG